MEKIFNFLNDMIEKLERAAACRGILSTAFNDRINLSGNREEHEGKRRADILPV